MNTEANVSKAADVEENLCNKIKEMCKISEDQGVRLKKIEENNNLASSLNKLIDMMRKRRARNQIVKRAAAVKRRLFYSENGHVFNQQRVHVVHICRHCKDLATTTSPMLRCLQCGITAHQTCYMFVRDACLASPYRRFSVGPGLPVVGSNSGGISGLPDIVDK